MTIRTFLLAFLLCAPISGAVLQTQTTRDGARPACTEQNAGGRYYDTKTKTLYQCDAGKFVAVAAPDSPRLTVSRLPHCGPKEWGAKATVTDAVAMGDLQFGGGEKTIYVFCDGESWIMSEQPDAFAVLDTQFTRDGAYKVELADFDIHMRYEVFSTKLSTGVRKRISGNMPALAGEATSLRAPSEDAAEGWDCASFVLSSDETRVVYRSGRAAFGDYILSSTPIYQQAAFRISGPSGGQVFPGYFAFAPASIVYSTDLIPGGPQTTWVVPVAGGVMPTLAVFLSGFEGGNLADWSGRVER